MYENNQQRAKSLSRILTSRLGTVRCHLHPSLLFHPAPQWLGWIVVYRLGSRALEHEPRVHPWVQGNAEIHWKTECFSSARCCLRWREKTEILLSV